MLCRPSLGPTRRPRCTRSRCNLRPLWPEDRDLPALQEERPKTRSSTCRASYQAKFEYQVTLAATAVEPKQEPRSLKHTVAVRTQRLTKTSRTQPTFSRSEHSVPALSPEALPPPGSMGHAPAAVSSLSFCRLYSEPAMHLLHQVGPNPSFEPTRYGRQRKPGSRHMVHHREPGLRRLPPRASQLQR